MAQGKVHKIDVDQLIFQAWQPPSSEYALTDQQVASLALYLEILNHWNRIHSLTAIESLQEQIHRHLMDALAVWPEISSKMGAAFQAADIGCGMGVPGIVLALVMPQSRFDLIERQQKKTAFLRHVTARLGLSDRVRVLEQDVRQARVERDYDLLISRAFASLMDFIEMSFGLSGPNTCWAAMTGRVNENISKDTLIKMSNKKGDVVVEDVVKVRVPGVNEARHLIWIRRRS